MAVTYPRPSLHPDWRSWAEAFLRELAQRRSGGTGSVQILSEGSLVGAGSQLSFFEGPGGNLTITPIPGGARVEIGASGGGGGGGNSYFPGGW
jgi:hypothetical protein